MNEQDGVQEKKIEEHYETVEEKLIKKLEDTLDSVEAIISGQFNHIPESTFAFVGGLSEVIEKFNSTQQVNVQQQVLK